MISCDAENLFTNVPLDKTIKIILGKICQERILDTSIPQKGVQNYYTYAQNMFILATVGEYT